MRDEQTDPELVRRLQNAIDMLPSPIFIKDGDCRYIACNRAFEAYIGLPRSSIVGATVHDVAPAELAATYEKADRDLLASGGTQTYETNVRYADGSHHDAGTMTGSGLASCRKRQDLTPTTRATKCAKHYRRIKGARLELISRG